jgi:signal transduction histidine kinase
VPRPSPEALLVAAYHARTGGKTILLDGAYGAMAPVAGTNWTVAYLAPKPESLGVMPTDTAVSVIFLITILAAVALATVLVVQISLRPVVALSAGARLLGSGNLSLRLPPAEVQEFETVVEAFNRMAARLEASRNELLEANRTLEHRVEERTRALEAEQEKRLRAERLSTLGLLSSAIAHDLRNPLNNVSIGIQWLQLRPDQALDEKAKARLEVIERETRRMDQIIRTLLAFARTGEPDRQPVDLNEVLDEVADVVHPPEGIALEIVPNPQLPLVMADRTQLFQVLENLIGNAIQAVGTAGRVHVASERNGAWCALTVSDTGPGIPAERQASIFEPLVTTRSTGTGLGLALCKRIVEAHGGRISLSSPPGEGATFRVELPLDAEEVFR